MNQLDLFSDELIAPKYDLAPICDPKFAICAQPWTLRLTSHRTWSLATNKKVTVFVPVDLEYPGLAGFQIENIESLIVHLQRAFAETNLTGPDIYLDALHDLCRMEPKVVSTYPPKTAPVIIDFMGGKFAAEYVLSALAAIDNPRKAQVAVKPYEGILRDGRTMGHVLLIRDMDTDARAFIMGWALPK